MNFYDYAGAIHLHSNYSFDDHVPLNKIVAAAQQNSIDILLLTDHGTLQARRDGWEGWRDKVLVIVGEEISPRFNHYLAFNIYTPVQFIEDAAGIKPQQYIDEVNQGGGFGFIAHPDHEGTKTFHVKHYPWNDWSVTGYTGFSIWDFMTDWQSSLTSYFAGLGSYLFPAFFLRGPRAVTLARWDKLNQTQKVVGIGELDNHASIKKFLGIKFEAYPFAKAFKFIRTHLLTREPFSGDAQKDIPLALDALRNGCAYIAMEYFRSARGFHFSVNNISRQALPGDSLELQPNTKLTVSLPCPAAYCRIICNGVVAAEDVTKNMTFQVNQAGVYRVEVLLKSLGRFRPWIFSNPIFIR